MARQCRFAGIVLLGMLTAVGAACFVTGLSLSPAVPPRPARPERPGYETDLQPVLSKVQAVLLAVVLSFSFACPVAASPEAERQTVEAAWGFVKRNFYDQSFNRQDWSQLHERYLQRLEKGERAETIVRDMVQSLGDRYSRVIDAQSFEQLMAFDPLGVGLVLARNDAKEVIISSPPFSGSSAAKAGLKQGDTVDAVDDMNFKELSLLAVADRVSQRDPASVVLKCPGRQVTLERLRQAKPQNQVESGVVTNSSGHKVGFLRLRSFGARSALEMAAALPRLREQGAEEWLIDVRGNGGGSFPAALEAAELFLPKGAVAAQVKLPSDAKPIRVGEGDSAAPATEPLAVLVDAGSASASEVLAVALRGNCRAPLIGTRTFGKAAVQGVFGLPNKEAVALTVARYSGPHGESIEGGLEPDLESLTLPGGLSPAGLLSALGAPLSSGDYASVDVRSASETSLAACKA